MVVVLERDDNSWHRGRQGKKDPSKIRGEDKYKDRMTGQFNRDQMGTVKVQLDYSFGKLVVNLNSAHHIAGKKSQDSYANVFLIQENPKNLYTWDEDQRVIYEKGHEKTNVFSKNLDPVFADKFTFQTDSNYLRDIASKSLVISIWDEDSSSRDDYMAGITVPLKNIDRFRKLGVEVEIKLHFQEMDGYPKRLSDLEVADLFGPLLPLVQDGWDLKECNNRLVTYIDRARVLREAYELKKSLSEVQLVDRTSIVVSEKNNVVIEQMERIKTMRANAARRRLEVEQRRRVAMEEAERNERRYKTQMSVLKERMVALDALAQEEANLRCKECSNSSLREYYRGGLTVSQRSSYKPAAVHAERLEIEAVDVRPLALGRSSRDEAYEKVVIKIRSEYHQRFLDALNEARKKYKKQSKVEIKIEEDIMRIYQTLIRQRADINGINYSLPGLLELESSRHYKARIRQLIGDIEGLRGLLRKREDEMGNLRASWASELREIDALLEANLAKLRDIMGRLSIYSVTKETEFDEVAAYQQLLDFEEEWVRQPKSKHRATVRSSTTRRSASTAAYTSSGYSHSSQTRTSRSSYSSSSKGRVSYGKRDSSGDSGKGYSKAATPDGTLDTSFGYERNSGFLENLQKEF